MCSSHMSGQTQVLDVGGVYQKKSTSNVAHVQSFELDDLLLAI